MRVQPSSCRCFSVQMALQVCRMCTTPNNASGMCAAAHIHNYTSLKAAFRILRCVVGLACQVDLTRAVDLLEELALRRDAADPAATAWRFAAAQPGRHLVDGKTGMIYDSCMVYRQTGDWDFA